MLIQAYKKSWIQDFNALKKALNDGLTGLNVSIEHIGSSPEYIRESA
ncbi:MAG: hypothetical protein U5L45_19715 [Saprospiraceae bacterium]|nr:hypothetical protein [Saprospiraceae bacterium]